MTSAQVINSLTQKSSSSASSKEGMSVGLRRSSKYSLHRPTMSPVSVPSQCPSVILLLLHHSLCSYPSRGLCPVRVACGQLAESRHRGLRRCSHVSGIKMRLQFHVKLFLALCRSSSSISLMDLAFERRRLGISRLCGCLCSLASGPDRQSLFCFLSLLRFRRLLGGLTVHSDTRCPPPCTKRAKTHQFWLKHTHPTTLT